MSKDIITKDKIEPTQDLKIAEFRKKIRKTQPHKHNSYLEIIYLTSGNGVHSVDMHNFQIMPPHLFVIRKEQVHHWEITSDPSGYVMIIKDEFITRSLDRELQKLFSTISAFNSIPVKRSDEIQFLFRTLMEENVNKEEFTPIIINGLLKALLGKILNLFQKEDMIKRSVKNSELHQVFLSTLLAEETIRNSVSYYADQLNTSPQNLNAICRKSLDKSAAEVLSEFIIREAKRLLIYSNKTISEIAFDLNFKDVSHFAKYFKRHTSITPLKFRINETA